MGDGTSILSDVNFNGSLDVGVSVSDGSLTSEVFMLNIESVHPTGVEDASDMAFYPNPFADHIRINSWENIEQKDQVHLELAYESNKQKRESSTFLNCLVDISDVIDLPALEYSGCRSTR